MKIAVSSTGKDLNAEIDPRFGRASCFIMVDPETMAYEVVNNAQDLAQGAGIQAAKTVADHHAEVLITGHCGPKAYHVLNLAKIRIITGAKGRVIDAINDYKNGNFKFSESADVEGHWI